MYALEASIPYLSSIDPEAFQAFRQAPQPEKIPAVAEDIFREHYTTSSRWLITRVVIAISMTFYHAVIESTCRSVMILALNVVKIALHFFYRSAIEATNLLIAEQWRKLKINFLMSYGYLYRLVNEVKGECYLQGLFLEKILCSGSGKEELRKKLLEKYNLFWWFDRKDLTDALIQLFLEKEPEKGHYNLGNSLGIKKYPGSDFQKTFDDADKIYQKLDADKQLEFIKYLINSFFKIYCNSVKPSEEMLFGRIPYKNFAVDPQYGYNVLAFWINNKICSNTFLLDEFKVHNLEPNSERLRLVVTTLHFRNILISRWSHIKDDEIIPPFILNVFLLRHVKLKDLRVNKASCLQISKITNTKTLIKWVRIKSDHRDFRCYFHGDQQEKQNIPEETLSKIFDQIDLEVLTGIIQIISSALPWDQNEYIDAEYKSETAQQEISPLIKKFYDEYGQGPKLPIDGFSNCYIVRAYATISKTDLLRIEISRIIFNRLKKSPQRALWALSKEELSRLKYFFLWHHRLMKMTRMKMPKPIQKMIMLQLFADNMSIKFIGVQRIFQGMNAANHKNN